MKDIAFRKQILNYLVYCFVFFLLRIQLDQFQIHFIYRIYVPQQQRLGIGIHLIPFSIFSFRIPVYYALHYQMILLKYSGHVML